MDWLLRHWTINLALMVLLLGGGVVAVAHDIAQAPSDQHSAAIWSAVLGGLAGLVVAFASFGANMLFAPDGSRETQGVSAGMPGRAWVSVFPWDSC